MTQPLPVVARRRILGGAHDRLSAESARVLPSYAIPVTSSGWLSALQDLSPVDRAEALGRAADELVSATDAACIRRTGELFVDRAVLLARDLRLMIAFGPARGADVASLRQAVLALAESVIKAVKNDTPPPDALAWNRLHAQAARLTQDQRDLCGMSQDPFTSAFGLAPAGGYDLGRRTAYQLLAVYRENLDDLTETLLRILEVLPYPNRTLKGAVASAVRLLDSPAPLLTLQAAVEVYDAIGTGMDGSSDRTVEALVDLQRGVPRSATNAQHSTDLSSRQTDEVPQQRALRDLELYKNTVEGQVRPWIWTLLRMDGAAAAAPHGPMLSQLRDQAQASSNLALKRAVRLVETAARNAQAHEDAVWDPDDKVLLIDGVAYSHEELCATAARASSCSISAAIVLKPRVRSGTGHARASKRCLRARSCRSSPRRVSRWNRWPKRWTQQSGWPPTTSWTTPKGGWKLACSPPVAAACWSIEPAAPAWPSDPVDGAKPIHNVRQTLEGAARSLSRSRARPLSVRDLQSIITRLDAICASRPAPPVVLKRTSAARPPRRRSHPTGLVLRPRTAG